MYPSNKTKSQANKLNDNPEPQQDTNPIVIMAFVIYL